MVDTFDFESLILSEIHEYRLPLADAVATKVNAGVNGMRDEDSLRAAIAQKDALCLSLMDLYYQSLLERARIAEDSGLTGESSMNAFDQTNNARLQLINRVNQISN